MFTTNLVSEVHHHRHHGKPYDFLLYPRVDVEMFCVSLGTDMCYIMGILLINNSIVVPTCGYTANLLGAQDTECRTSL